MNERIRDLWSQAGGRYDSGNQHTWPQYTIDDPERFAELIIKQCAKSLWTEECHTSDLALEEFERNSAKIKEHFGVKE
jgi:hypothetical protein